MEIHHLSHIDLDGYVAQLVARECFNKDGFNIKFYNANYGKEILVRISDMLYNIKCSYENKFLILITDLNLNANEASFLQEEVNLLNMSNKNTRIKLLDHHITGKECAVVYDWYYLDSSICASKITFNFLKNEFGFNEDSNWLEIFCNMVNAADTWLEEDIGFNFGKVAMGMIAQSKEFSRFMFDDFDKEFKFNMLLESKKYFLDSNNNIIKNGHINLDNNIFLFKKKILGGNINSQTMDDILSLKQTTLLSENKESYTIYCKSKKGLLTYGIGGISFLANLFLDRNNDYDFFMDIGLRGSVSLRSNGKCDVSEIAKLYFNGGGHRNASGGKFDGFKETFLYREAKEQVVNLFQ